MSWTGLARRKGRKGVLHGSRQASAGATRSFLSAHFITFRPVLDVLIGIAHSEAAESEVAEQICRNASDFTSAQTANRVPEGEHGGILHGDVYWPISSAKEPM